MLVCLGIVLMETSSTSSDTNSTSSNDSDSNEEENGDPWNVRHAVLINNYNITLRREQQNSRSELNRERAFIARRENFLRQYDLNDAH